MSRGSLVFLLSLLVTVWSRDELSTFHYTNDGELVYFQGSFTKNLNYTEARHFCQLMGGDLPTSFEHIFPLVLTTRGSDGDLFWLGPMKRVNESYYEWPNGARFQYNEALNTNKDCQDGRCCAVVAKWSAKAGGGRHLDYLEKSCYLIAHPVCVIKHTLGSVGQKVEELTRTHDSVKRELNKLRPAAEPSNRIAFDSAPVVMETVLETNYHKSDITGRVYYYDSSLGTYDESIEYCRELGGVLTPVTSREEATYLAKLIGRFRFAWTGSTKSTQSTRYTWLDNSPIDASLWTIPPSKDGEYALVVSSYSDSMGQLREVRASGSNRRVCLMTPTPTVKPTEATVAPTEPPTEVTEPIVTDPPKPVTDPPTKAPTEPPTEPPTRVTDFTLPPGDLDAKLEFLASRVNRQEELLQQLVSLLKKSYGP